MDEQALRSLIRAIIEEIMRRDRPRRALVMFTGALLGFDDALQGLRELKQAGLPMTLLMTEAAECVLDVAKINALGMDAPTVHLIDQHDILIVPTMTVNTTAKVAHGIADSLATNMISEFISYGKLVVAASSAADPDSAAKQARFPLMPPAQAALMRDNLNRVRALGVRTCEVKELACCVKEVLDMAAPPPVPPLPVPSPTPNPPVLPSLDPVVPPPAPSPVSVLPSPALYGPTVPCDARIVGAREVMALPDGAVLRVRPGAIVTDFATDMAEKRSIIIERG